MRKQPFSNTPSPPCLNVDAVDFHILGALSREPLRAKESIAQDVRLSSGAVRKRLARLAADGVLQGWQATPCADLFGRRGLGLAFEASLDLAALIELPDVVYAADSVDGLSGVLGNPEEPGDWQDCIESHAGQPATHAAPTPPRPIPEPGPLQWKVLRALLDNPVSPAAVLGRKAGLGSKTAGRVRAELMQGAVDIQPLLRPSRTGATAFHAYLEGHDKALGQAMNALEETIEVAAYAGSRYVFCRAASLQEQASRMAAVRRIDGITRADLVLNRDFVFATRRVRGWIDDELARWRR